MIRSFFVLIFFVVLLQLVNLFGFSTVKAQAGDYKVKPYLIIPSNWKTRITPEKEAKYKENILNSLTAAQEYYRKKLSGLTFEYLRSVETINAPNSYPDDPSDNIAGHLFNLGIKDFSAGANSVPGNFIYIVYIVGSGNETSAATCSVPCYETPNGASNLALISHELLEKLGSDAEIYPSSPITKKRFAQGVVAHELGHTFNLVFSGWAIAHPCSIISKGECNKQASSGTYPPEYEYSKGLMGIGYQFFPESNLNNTIFNPEIQKIFQSPFIINPNKNPAPTPEPLKTNVLVSTAKIDSFGPNPIAPGSILTIKGSGLGKSSVFTGGWKALENILGSGIDLSLENWTDNEVTLRVKSSYEYPTKWLIYLAKPDGERVDLPEPLIIQGTKINNITPSTSSSPKPAPSNIIGELPCQELFTKGICVEGDRCPTGSNSTGSFCSLSQICCSGKTSISTSTPTPPTPTPSSPSPNPTVSAEPLVFASGTPISTPTPPPPSPSPQACLNPPRSINDLNNLCPSPKKEDPKLGYAICNGKYPDCSPGVLVKRNDGSLYCFNQSAGFITDFASCPPTPTPPPPTPKTSPSPSATPISTPTPTPPTPAQQNPLSTQNPSASPTVIPTPTTTSSGPATVQPTSAAVAQVKKRKISKILINVVEDNSVMEVSPLTFNSPPSIRLPVEKELSIYHVVVIIQFEDGINPKTIPFTFYYKSSTGSSGSKVEKSIPTPTPDQPSGNCTGVCEGGKCVVDGDSIDPSAYCPPASSAGSSSTVVEDSGKTTQNPNFSILKSEGLGSCYTNPSYDSNICPSIFRPDKGGAGGQCGPENAGKTVNVPCQITCPDGNIAYGNTVSTCRADGCYYNDSCSCDAVCTNTESLF